MTERTPRSVTSRIWFGGFCIIAVAITGVLFMMGRQKSSLADETKTRIKELKDGPTVKAITAGISSSGKGLTLLGEAVPFQTVTLYAKTSGYMNKIFVDKGDKVHNGQLLATIVSPETDQAYIAAVADLENKKKILKRDQALMEKEYISKEDEETSETAVKMAEAQVESLRQQQQYKNITAPFAGTITARFADAGALVQNATASQSSALPVVQLSQLDEIRIYIYVPQGDADYLREGYPVTITKTEDTSVKIAAHITRISGELDPKTRMMLMEIDLSNKDNIVVAGSYVQVCIHAPETKNMSLPSEALVIKGGNYFVAYINADSTIHYQPVTIGNNDGIHVTVLKGVQTGDKIAINVGASLNEGQKVRVQL